MAKVYTDVKTLSIDAGELKLSSNSITSTNSVISINPAGSGSSGTVESRGVLKVIDDDVFGITLILQATDGLGNGDFGATSINFKYTSLMLKAKSGTVYPWITLENEGGGGNAAGRTTIYDYNDMVVRFDLSGIKSLVPIITTDAADATSAGTGSIRTSGGIGVTKDVFVGGSVNFGSNDAVIGSTSGIFYSPDAGVTRYPLQYGNFTQISDTTVLTAPTRKVLVGDTVSVGVGTLLIPANYFKVGSSFIFKCGGYTTAGVLGSLTLTVQIGGQDVAFGVIDPITDGVGWTFESHFCVRSIGINGASSAITNIAHSTNAEVQGTFLSTINTTTANDFRLQVIGSTTKTIVCTNATLSTVFHPQ